ncbi:MAG: DUF11 domain-containing protein [Clostridia bacterium]|nr:DUF11 domain-containing protein [Clostridia bacterium]
MQKRRIFREKLIASLIVFMMMFTNFATLGTALVSFAAEDTEDINFSVQFVNIVKDAKNDAPEPELESSENVAEPVVDEAANIGDVVGNIDENNEAEQPEEIPVEEKSEEDQATPEEGSKSENIQNEEGLAIEITLGVRNNGYLKNAKIDIKDLANQIFKLKDDISLGEYIQSIDENKIKLKQVNSGTEVKIYLPIELKTESLIDVNKIQEGTQINLSGTYVDNDGNEEIITKESKSVINISNNVNILLGATIEKYIPFVKEGVNQAIAQLKVTACSETKNELPIKDTTYEISIPQIEGAIVKDLSVSAINTSYTNGLSNGDVVFTLENWSYQDGKVRISVDNTQKDGKYQMNTGNDEFIISYTYENCPEISEIKLQSSISAKSNVFTSEGTKEINSSIEKEYDLSGANSNIITYEVTGKTQDMSKGYLYANVNSEIPEYELEFENAFSLNISRVDLLKTVEIRESAEYFQDEFGNKYNTSINNAINSYYKSVKVNRENLLSIIGETGNLELLSEDGTSLIQVNKDTEIDEDGYITISFGENRIDKILMRINNPIGEGILNIGAIKAMAKTTYGKSELMMFRQLVNEYVAAAQLQEGIVTEMGNANSVVNLVDTITNATISLNRNEISTIVENENIEINISLNNASNVSDMYTNPVFEVVLPEEVENVNIKDINLLYGNDELEILNVETLRNELNQIVIRITLKGSQTKYTLGDSERGTTIILKTDMQLDMYRASRDSKAILNYYNEDATNYATSSDWKMITENPSDALIDRQGNYDASLKVVAPEGFVNAQMISNYKADASIISVNQGSKKDTIDTFKEARTAEMKMILINNTDEEMNNVHILGRTIFNGNKDIINNESLGTNQDAPMISEIVPLSGNVHNATIYYSENGEATDSLEEFSNGWTTTPEDLSKVKSYLIVVDGTVEIGNILMYSYNFEIPANLNNNLDLAGTFGTYYLGTKTAGIGEADKVVLSTGDAPVLKVDTVSDLGDGVATEGQRIKYTVRVTNEGRSVAEDVVVNSAIPVGTTYIENGELRPDVTELKIDMESINPGKSEEVTYEVEVNKASTAETYIETKNNIEARGLEEPIYTTTNSFQVETAEVNIDIESDKTGRIVPEDSTINYTTFVTNMRSEPLENCKVVQSIPEGVTVLDAYVEGFRDDGVTSYKESEGIYDEASRTVTWNVDRLVVFKGFKLEVRTNDIEELERNLISYSKVTASNLDKEYTSNEVSSTLARPELEVNYYSNNDNKYIKEGNTIKYVLRLKNVGKAEAEKIDITNKIPKELRVTGLECVKNGTSYSGLAGKNLSMVVSLEPGETADVVMSCTAENLSNSVDEMFTGNNWVISGKNVNTVATPAIENIVQQNPEMTNNTYENVKIQTTTDNEESKPVYVNKEAKTETISDDTNSRTYRVLGRAFNDMNHNGQRDGDEEGMADIVVKLCDASSQEVIGQTTTNSIGEYLIENVLPGEYYIKFEYDNTKYQVTDYKKEGVNSDRNSDAIISNYKAVTDKIKITDTSISDIDIGLVRAGIFDLSLDTNINKVIVQNDKETNTYEMENSKLAKVDINPKYANSSNIYVEYTVTVTNKGEIAGYVKRIVDYLPNGLTLDTDMNPNWYVAANGNAYNQELEDVLIQPGESKTVTLVLTKQMTEDGTGIINNTFEIEQTYNEYAISDIDSTEGNRAQGEDDMSTADIIIGIQTGGSLINVMIISTTLITLLIALYVVKIQIDKRNKGVIV